MSEKYLGENSTPLLINQIKENCTQKRSTLPIASIDELGNTYQYTGTTSGSLVHGYFYECVSDGAVTPTYSWQQVNVQPTVGTPTAATTTFDNTTSGLQATNVQGAIDEVEGRVDNIEGKVPSTATSTNKVIEDDSLGTAAFKDSTDRVSPNNTALVESQSVYSAINTALSSIYTPRGDITCAELTSDLLIAANVGNIYETSDSGTTSALFLQGVGHPIATGSNVGIISAGQGRILFNLMANAFDLTGYQKKDLTSAIEGETTVESALSALSTNKATQTDLTAEINTRATLGAHNLFDIEAWLKSIGTNFTKNGNVYTLSTGGYVYSTPYVFSDEDIDVTLTGVISSLTSNNVRFELLNSNNQQVVSLAESVSEASGHGCKIRINWSSNGNFTISEPMIRLASDSDTTYRPYVPTNSQLLSYKDNGVLGAKNLLPNNLVTQVVNGITFTVNSDGTVLVNGTNSVANPWVILIAANILLKKGSYILSGVPEGAYSSGSGCILALINSSTLAGIATDYGSDAEFTLAEDTTVTLRFYVTASASISNKTFKPMIRLASDTDTTYQPYAKSNRELTENVASLDAMYDGKTPSAVSDLNVPLTAGGATVAFTRHLNNTTNAPTNGGGLEITWSSSDKYGAQLTLTDGGLYFRTNSSGTISAWQKIST